MLASLVSHISAFPLHLSLLMKSHARFLLTGLHQYSGSTGPNPLIWSSQPQASSKTISLQFSHCLSNDLLAYKHFHDFGPPLFLSITISCTLPLLVFNLVISYLFLWLSRHQSSGNICNFLLHAMLFCDPAFRLLFWGSYFSIHVYPVNMNSKVVIPLRQPFLIPWTLKGRTSHIPLTGFPPHFVITFWTCLF